MKKKKKEEEGSEQTRFAFLKGRAQLMYTETTQHARASTCALG